MANFTNEKKLQVWSKGKEVDGYDASKYRKDACDAWIQWDKYGTEHDYGWEIDHVYPEAKGGNDNLINLRPMQWENNRSKADDFPGYNSEITSDGNKNVRKKQELTVSDALLDELKKLYNL